MKFGSNLMQWLSAALAFLSVLHLVMIGWQIGPGAVVDVLWNYYQDLMNLLFGWAGRIAENYGRLPSWWREGLLMLALIIGQWFQVIRDGKAHWLDALEYFLVALVTGASAYFIEAATDGLEAVFFGIAGVFIQLIVRGALSFARNNPDSEAWAGRYLLRQSAVFGFGTLLFVATNAGLSLIGL